MVNAGTYENPLLLILYTMRYNTETHNQSNS